MTSPEDPAAGAEEELTPPSGKRRLRLDLFVAGGILLGVVLVGRALADDRRHPGPAASGSASGAGAGRSAEVDGDPSFTEPTSVFVTRADGQRRVVPRLPPRTADDPAACPAALSCSPETAVAGRGPEPVTSRFPRAELVHAESVRLRDEPWVGALWFRRLIFRINGGELSIRIIARGPDAQADGGRIGDELFVRTTLQQYEVTIQAPAATGVTLADLRRIAADDRLLAT